MAGQGGPKAPDYRPRPPAGSGALANRQDLTRGTGAQIGQTPITGAPTPPITGTGGAYGQRQELQGLAGGAPMAGRSRGAGGASRAAAGGVFGTAPEDQEPTLPPLAPMPQGSTAAYSDADIAELEQMLPVLHLMASQPDASDFVRNLFHQAGEDVLNYQQASAPVPSPLGPAPEWTQGY